MTQRRVATQQAGRKPLTLRTAAKRGSVSCASASSFHESTPMLRRSFPVAGLFGFCLPTAGRDGPRELSRRSQRRGVGPT